MNEQELEFYKAAKSHDLTYQFSDDHRAYKEGERTLWKVKHLAKSMEYSRAAEIWNQVVDEKIRPESREGFYWGKK